MGMFRPIGRDGAGTQREARAGDGMMSMPLVSTQAADSAQVLTVASIAAGYYRRTSITVGRTDTTDTAALIAASSAFSNMDIGDSYLFVIANHSGQTLTIAGGTGVTIVGATTLATLTSRLALLVRTGAATFDLNLC
jgi:hypothetical protein